MPKVVRRVGRHPEDRLVILETDSTETTAITVSFDTYVPGKAVSDYDHDELAQIDTDELKEI